MSLPDILLAAALLVALNFIVQIIKGAFLLRVFTGQ